MNRITRKNFKLALVEKGGHYNQPTIYLPMMEKKMGFIVVVIVCKDTKITQFFGEITTNKKERHYDTHLVNSDREKIDSLKF